MARFIAGLPNIPVLSDPKLYQQELGLQDGDRPTIDQMCNWLHLDKGTGPTESMSWSPTHPLHQCMGYSTVYDALIPKDRPIVLVEVGIADPRFPLGSMNVWKSCLHPDSRIIGVDIKPDLALDGVEVIQADASSKEQLQRVVDSIGPDGADIIIDDGGHHPHQIKTTFEMLWPCVKSGGHFFIEDVGPDEATGPFSHPNGDILDEMRADPNVFFHRATSSYEIYLLQKPN